jgi:hypothetical protein
MNALHHNPNIRRYVIPLTLIIASLGNAACTAKHNSTPPPAEATTSAPSRPNPSCTVKAKVNGKTATFSLDAKNEDEPGIYMVDKVEYQYGDGQTDTSGAHTYAKAGSYTVGASMVMDVAPDAEAPFRDGFAIPCSPATATIN